MDRFFSSLAPADWVIVLSYLAISLLIGGYFRKTAGRSMKDYFVSGRNLPWWALGTSMVATTFAADTPLAITGWIRTEGIWKNWFWWSYLVSHVFVVLVFARLWRRARVITDNELIELRYSGKPAAFLRGFKAFYFATLFNFIVMGWVIRAMAKILFVFFGVETTVAIVVSLLIAVIYTMLGGLWGVVVTDMFQYAVAVIGTVVFALVVIYSPQIGGFEAFWNKTASLGSNLSFFATPGSGSPVSAGFFDSSFFVFLIYITVIWWSSHNSDGGGYIIQRLSSAKNERHATLGMAWFTLNHYVIRLWPWVLIAVCSLLIFPDAKITGGDNEAIYVVMVNKFLGPGLKGLLFITFLSAFMSTITTQLNWGVSYVMNDLYRRFLKPRASERHYVLVSRLCTVLLSLMAGYAAFRITNIGKAWVFLWAMSAGIGLVLVLRWFWWRVNAWSEIAALAASLGTMLVVTLYTGLKGVELTMKHQILVVPVSIVVWVAATFITKPEPMGKLAAFYERIRPWGFWGPVRKLAAGAGPSSPFSRILINWALGVVALTSAMLGVGKVLLGRHTMGASLLILALLAGALFVRNWRENLN